ncbi:efflux RND transporter periplasmic adaptor subunit [Xylophilus rhododendri]|uniref:Efflux RND transporter periplasmic adaptor subunit n=1 Tax=Xylophilus rhododendri TaxID=2697032 RepID=A0A857J9U3_9BURK|nr:efflux RND transporter periplasmic adaptor subunit [Xylophilus rhododendri]QHJ00498.1 efflux RND transporter periplasmic adaptor subunit [Xylophilus rhododendri]
MAAPFLVAGVLVALLLPARIHAQAGLRQQTQAQALTPVAVVHAQTGPATRELLLPARVMAFADTPIYARTSGYVKRWTVDIGAPVKAGQLLAEIEAPELDDSLRQAQAAQVRAVADADLARVTAERWQALGSTEAVTRQEIDQKVADAQAKAALVAQAQADVARLGKTASYKQVLAPFDGVVTARNLEVGTLINAGSSAASAGVELFHIASSSRLRIAADVPEADAYAATVGQPATVEAPDQPGRMLAGTISRRAEAIDPVARTLHVEVDVDNREHVFLPGSFAQVRFRLADNQPRLSLPSTALLMRPEGVRVAVVRADNTIALQPVRLGRNSGTQVQVLEGLTPAMAVVLNPPDSLLAGQAVQVVTPQAGA